MDCHRDKNRVVKSTVRTGVWIFAVAPIYTHSLSLRLEMMNWLLRSKFPPGAGDATQGIFLSDPTLEGTAASSWLSPRFPTSPDVGGPKTPPETAWPEFWILQRHVPERYGSPNGLTAPFFSVRSGSPRPKFEKGPEVDDSNGVHSFEKLPDCLTLPFIGRAADGDTQPKNGLAHSRGSISAVCSLQT
jgi:hypothetical protein